MSDKEDTSIASCLQCCHGQLSMFDFVYLSKVGNLQVGPILYRFSISIRQNLQHA